jgi:hypothetical protein
MIYAAIGKVVVKVVKGFVLYRYGTQLRVGAGALVVGIAVAGYLLNRDVPEG